VSGLAQWGPPATRDFLGLTLSQTLRELAVMPSALLSHNEFDLTRLRGLLKAASL